MICPVCEHAQQTGAECDACGARLAGAAQAPVAVERLPELETTHLAPGPTSTPATGGDDQTWLERTASEPVHAPVEPLEVERGAEGAPPGVRTAPAPRACRYCRTPVAPADRFCGGCGMRIGGSRRAEEEPAPAAVRCRSCGAVAAGVTCPGCGARLPAPEVPRVGR